MRTVLSAFASALLLLCALPIMLLSLMAIPVIFLISVAIFLLFVVVFIALQVFGIPVPVYQKLPNGSKVKFGELRRFKFIPL